MRPIGLALVLIVIMSSAICQESEPKAMPAPTLPFYDWKACPFEGCSYRQWTARKAAVLFNTWKRDRRPIARISKGEAVTGITGVVITSRPGTIRMDRDLPENNLKRGDLILTYTYRGEGVSAVWFKGRFDPELAVQDTRRIKQIGDELCLKLRILVDGFNGSLSAAI